jgi:hypothetical protein
MYVVSDCTQGASPYGRTTRTSTGALRRSLLQPKQTAHVFGKAGLFSLWVLCCFLSRRRCSKFLLQSHVSLHLDTALRRTGGPPFLRYAASIAVNSSQVNALWVPHSSHHLAKGGQLIHCAARMPKGLKRSTSADTCTSSLPVVSGGLRCWAPTPVHGYTRRVRERVGTRAQVALNWARQEADTSIRKSITVMPYWT